MAILLRHEDIVRLISVDDAIEAVRRGLHEQAAGQVQLPLRLTVDTRTGWLRTMPVTMEGSGFMGYKVMHSTTGVGVGYMVALYSMDSGNLVALLDADWITALRTAATTAIATDYLAKPVVRDAGVLGSGEQARVHVMALVRVRPLERVRVFSPRPERRKAFAEALSRILNTPVRAVDRAVDAVTGVDVVTIAVRAGDTPVFHGEWMAPGVHVNGISSVRPTAREIDEAAWERADLIVVDDRSHVLESGDGRRLRQAATVDPASLVELWELVGGRAHGRQHADQMTLFKSVGNALQDLALAVAVYRHALEAGVGQDLGDFPRLRGERQPLFAHERPSPPTPERT